MKRILILGSGGSGKSTLASALGEALNIEVVHLDSIYWNPGWQPTERARFIEKLRPLLAAEEWIIEGNYSGTLDLRLERADTVVFLDLPRWLCLYRVVKRRIAYRGRSRPDMAEGCREKLDPDFVKWVWRYPKDKRPEMLKKLQKCRGEKTVIHLQSRRQVKRFMKTVRQAHRTHGSALR